MKRRALPPTVGKGPTRALVALMAAGVVGATAAPVSVWWIDARTGIEVILVVPWDDATIELNRALYTPGDRVEALYDTARSEPVRIVLAEPERLIRPPEAPAMVLYRVDPAGGETPWQSKTLWLLARVMALASATVGAVAGAALVLMLRRR